MALFPPPPHTHSGRLLLVAVLMGLVAAAVLAAGNIARAQDPPEPTTHRITRGDTDTELQTSLNAVFASDGTTLAAVTAGDIIEFGPGVYEDIGRVNGSYLRLDKDNLTVRGASDPRLGEADGQCDANTDTILTGSSGFDLRVAGITVEHFCFQNIDDGSLAHASPHTLASIRLQHTADGATIRRNRIDNTISMGVYGRIGSGNLQRLTFAENEFIDIGLIATNGAGTAIQPRDGNGAPSAIDLVTLRDKSNLTITDNLFEGSARFGASLSNIKAGVISGNTFRNMAKSAVSLDNSSDITLDDNTYEGNNHAAWRVVQLPNWLNDYHYGLSSIRRPDKRATMESAALHNLMRMNKAQAVAAGMDGDLYAAAAANKVYRDPHLHAAVLVARSTNVAISNSTFTNNHNSVAICGHLICRVDGLEAVGADGDTGRSPAYIALLTYPGSSVNRTQSSVTLSDNEFTDSDTRSFDGPGSIGNHVVIGYHRGSSDNPSLGPAAGTITYGAGNSFSGSGVFGGAAPRLHQITPGDTDAALQTSLNAVFGSDGATLADVEAGDIIDFAPGIYNDIGRASGGFYLLLDKEDLTVRGARDPRKGEADGQCDPAQDTILTGSSGFELSATVIRLQHFCFQDIDDGSGSHTNPHRLAPIRVDDSGNGASIRGNRIDNTIGMGVNGRIASGNLSGVLITDNEFIDIGLIATNGADAPIQPRGTGQEPSAIGFDTSAEKTNFRVVDNLFEGSAWAAVNLESVTGGTISGNTFRNMAKSAVNVNGSNRVTLSSNTYEGNNHTAWRVVETADWLNDLKIGLSGSTVADETASMESAALQTSLRLDKDQAVALGMDGDLFDAATATDANVVYRDPRLHAAVRVATSTNVTISDSAFTNNHNSIAICGASVCRVEGLEAVGDDGDTGRAPAYISPDPAVTSPASTVTLSGNEFNNSDTRSFDGPGTIGNHIVIGYFRDAATTLAVGDAAGSIKYIGRNSNSFTGSGVFGGAALPPGPFRITRGDTDDELKASLDQVWNSTGATVADVVSGDTIEFGPGLYEDIGRGSGGFFLLLDKEGLILRGARDPRLGAASGECDPTTDTILAGKSGFDLRAANITLEHFCFQNIDDGSLAHANPQNLAPIRIRDTGDRTTIRRNRIDNTIGMGVDGRVSAGDLTEITIAENEFIKIGLIATNGAADAIQPRGTGREPSAIQFDTGRPKANLRVTDNLFQGSAWVALSLENVNGGTISGNTFRDMAKSAVNLNSSSDVILDDNTYEGNNSVAWRVMNKANWLNDHLVGPFGPDVGAWGSPPLESAALQTFLRLDKDQAAALGMDGALYDAAPANSVYRDPRVYAAVWIAASTEVVISNSAFTNNHNSVAICGHYVCRVDGLEKVGNAGDYGRAPAYITVYADQPIRPSTVTLTGNQFHNSDTRSFDGPGSIGNHLVIGHYRAGENSNSRGRVVGSFTYGAANIFTGDGVTYGGAAKPPPPPPVISAPPPIFVPPPPPFRKDEVAVVDGAAKLEANKVTVDLVKGSLPENAETVEATVTKLSRSKTPDAPDGGRFRIPSGAAFEIELEATLADETTQTLTELAAPATVCLPVPRAVNNPVVLRYDAETEEWVKLPSADSAEEDEVCALSASFSVYAVADEADHSEGLSANEINDFSVWEGDYPLTASELLAALLDVNPIWVRNDETWTGYATFEGEPIPGAIDFLVANGDTLWLGDGGSGRDTGEEGEG